MNLEQMTELFKWMTFINIGIFLISIVGIISMKKVMSKVHGKLFGINEEKISQVQYGWLGIYKIFVLVFNVVPFIALSLMK